MFDVRCSAFVIYLCFCLLTLSGPVTAHADDAFGPSPTWKAPAAADVRAEILKWLDSQSLADDMKQSLAAQWPAENDTAGGAALLERMAQTFAAANEDARKLVELCAKPKGDEALPEFAWLSDEKTPPLLRHNLALYYGRWLAQQNLYDESLARLAGLAPEQVVDPASLLFFQSIGHHRLVNTKQSRAAAQKLLERASEIPLRYRQLAGLMTEDLKDIDPDSLDHISRRMDDIRRRLDLGRAGKKVREVEDGVIASLDKLIEEEEEKQQQQQQQQSQAGGPNSPNQKPLEKGQVAPLKGPGKVDKKEIGRGSGWGALPPKQREEALQQIGKEFPAHFRDAIEQYFRKIASEEEDAE